MKQIWTIYTDWPVGEIHLRRVMFDIELPDKRITGIGVLHAHKNPEGLVSLEVWQDFSGPRENERSIRRLYQTEEIRFLIELPQNPDEHAFHLTSYKSPPNSSGNQ